MTTDVAHRHCPVDIMVAEVEEPVAAVCKECGERLQPGEVCSACGESFTLAEWDERHWPHQPDCGFFERGTCTCSDVVHARCCVYCHGEALDGR